jgi:putative FmdB family regulatory protein
MPVYEFECEECGERFEESRRRERESARTERLAETKRKRAAGEF